MLAQAVHAEAEEWLLARRHLCDPAGHRQVVRNGYLPEREILTGQGPIPVRQPRLRDHRPAEGRETFVSRILPPYLRRAKSVDERIPWLYLRGLSTGDYQEALQVLLGTACPNLSANVVIRTSNPMESTFATVRLRTAKTKGCGSPPATLAMVFKLAQGAEKSWRELNGVERLAEMLAGVKFVNGLKLAA
jgi:transposase-like protein